MDSTNLFSGSNQEFVKGDVRAERAHENRELVPNGLNGPLTSANLFMLKPQAKSERQKGGFILPEPLAFCAKKNNWLKKRCQNEQNGA